MDMKTLAKPIVRPAVTGYRLSRVLVTVETYDENGAQVSSLHAAIEDRLSPGALAEVETLAEETVKKAG